MDEVLIPLLAFLSVACVGSAVLVLRSGRRKMIEKRLYGPAGRAAGESSKPGISDAFGRLGKSVAIGKGSPGLRTEMIHAGYMSPAAPSIYLGSKIILLSVGLIVAAALHSLLDGWSVAVVQHAAPLGLRVAVPIAIALHKVPEGVALGGVMRAAVPSRAVALLWCLLAEGSTLAGGALALALAPHLGSLWTIYPLGLTAGWLVYLGYHALHEEWKRKGAAATSVSALAGGATAALIQRGAEALLR